jgi:hypothetical protein
MRRVSQSWEVEESEEGGWTNSFWEQGQRAETF